MSKFGARPKLPPRPELPTRGKLPPRPKTESRASTLAQLNAGLSRGSLPSIFKDEPIVGCLPVAGKGTWGKGWIGKHFK